jgi:rhodanese-related sulfurtransferase
MLAAMALSFLFMSCSGSDNSADKSVPEIDPTEITVNQLMAAADSSKDFFLVDVRTEPEYVAGHVPFTDAQIDYRELPSMMEYLPEDNNATIYLFCRSGRRSGIATDFLRKQGYVNAFNVKGGIIAWTNAGLPLDSGSSK